jgi:hypothetical protein
MTNTIDLSKVSFPDTMDLRTAAIYLGSSEMRIRTLARDGSVNASKSETGQWLFAKADLDTFKATPHVRKSGTRSAGEGKSYIVKIRFADHEPVKAFLGQYGIELQPRYDYAKQAAYKTAVAAKKAEAIANGTVPAKAAKSAK